MRDKHTLDAINRASGQPQNEMWNAVRAGVAAQPNAINALAVSGMNDAINRQGVHAGGMVQLHPPAAWYLMIVIGLLGNALVGYGSRSAASRSRFLPIMPIGSSPCRSCLSSTSIARAAAS